VKIVSTVTYSVLSSTLNITQSIYSLNSFLKEEFCDDDAYSYSAFDGKLLDVAYTCASFTFESQPSQRTSSLHESFVFVIGQSEACDFIGPEFHGCYTVQCVQSLKV